MLVTVVGPSGAGKDTLLTAARAALAGDARFAWVRRAITRPAEAGGEDHLPMTREAFAAARASGDFCLSWEAHGLAYGIPRAIEGDLAAGRVVVANLSRAVLAEAAARYPLRVLLVTEGLDIEQVANDGTPEQGVARMVAALSRAAAGARR
jgi:phosphonate metabolism protein PhnN/1,5-bisphosphokinase (PRPP-forming)